VDLYFWAQVRFSPRVHRASTNPVLSCMLLPNLQSCVAMSLYSNGFGVPWWSEPRRESMIPHADCEVVVPKSRVRVMIPSREGGASDAMHVSPR